METTGVIPALFNRKDSEDRTEGMKSKWKYMAAVMGLVLMMGSMTACGEDGGKVIFTTGFEEDELFRIGEVSCTLPEYMIYLTNMQNKYEDVLGAQIWQMTFEGTTLEENIKDIALARIAQMKSVYLLAKQKEVELTPEEEEKAEQAAREYYASLNDTEKKVLDISEQDILQLYREYALAEKVYEQIVAEVNPEISDDEARTVTLEQIHIRTYTTDVAGNRIEYSEAMKAECLETIQELRELLVTEEQDFTVLAGKYNEDDNIQYSFRRGEALPEIEEVAFQLQTNEISQVIVCDDGYYLLKCINTLDRAQTDENKLYIIKQRKQEAFSGEYDAFVDTLARKLNEKLWAKVELVDEQDVKTNDFFAIYAKYFS